VKITSARLADGREIVYYDEADDTVRALLDPRELGTTSTDAEIRYDVALDEWVAIAAHRLDRTHLPPTDECPLCPSRDGRQTEIPSDDYDVVVFENRFPTFSTSATGLVAAANDQTDLFVQQPGVGRCEVVLFTSDHDSSFSALTPARVRTVVEAWTDRTIALSAQPHVEQVFCFENRGREIGVTLTHPHGQIYAYPFVTPRTRRTLDASRRYRERSWRNLFADLLAAEQRDQVRVVASSRHWTAFVPFAARWPIEVHLYPNRHVVDLPGLSDEERDDFCGIYLDVLRRMEALYDDTMPYIAGWHQAPVRVDRDLGYLHLEVFSIRRAPGKLKYLAGSESAMGAFINDVLPETAAEMLRAVTL
jgi:UDPglucose--hexose-1-phosphate uridylyltransferase